MNYRKLNFGIKEELTRKVLERARELFPEELVMSSSLGRYSAVMLHLAAAQIPGIPVINLSSAEETECTGKHREELRKRLNLNLNVFKIGDDKTRALKDALETLRAGALISGVLWEETRNRERFEFFMDDRTFGIQRIYPLLHWKETDLLYYIRKHNLPINENYTDSFKESSGKKECGIHLFRDGAGI